MVHLLGLMPIPMEKVLYETSRGYIKRLIDKEQVNTIVGITPIIYYIGK